MAKLTRMGDFYEAFGDDAKVVADILGLVLTKTRDGRPACGIPAWRMDEYVLELKANGIEVSL